MRGGHLVRLPWGVIPSEVHDHLHLNVNKHQTVQGETQPELQGNLEKGSGESWNSNFFVGNIQCIVTFNLRITFYLFIYIFSFISVEISSFFFFLPNKSEVTSTLAFPAVQEEDLNYFFLPT